MTQEYDTTTERKLWFSGAWGRSLPTSFLQFGPDCIACDVLLEIVSLTFSQLYSLLCFLFCLFDFLPEL